MDPQGGVDAHGQLDPLSKQTILEVQQKTTPKARTAEWKAYEGKAGQYVQLTAGGGVAGFDFSRDDTAYPSPFIQ
jgi:hypothetical protein